MSVTPEKAPKKNKKRITLFALSTGKHIVFRSSQVADKYAAENGDAIVATHTFPSLAACQRFQNDCTVVPKVEGDGSQQQTTLDEQAAIERINRRRIANAPSKSIMFLYKVTSFSRACVFFMRVLDQHGAPQWYYKQKDHTHTLKAYADDVSTVINGDQTKAMIDNMDYTERRDLEKADNVAKKVKNYVQYEQFSYFLLPVDDFKDDKQEAEYVEQTLTFFGNQIKQIMTSTLYLGALKECTASYAPSLVKHLFGEGKGISFKQFIQECRVVVRPLREYTDVIPRDKVCFVRNILLEHDQSAPKYETISNEDIQDGSDSDSDEGDDDTDSAIQNTASYANTFNPGKQSSVTNDTDIETGNV